MAKHAQAERHALADLLLKEGPDAPTLCEGWKTADLAAHLVTRERRPDAGIGLVLPAASGYTERVQRGIRDGRSWPDLVEMVRSGPPAPLRPLDESINTVEYFVHHEDVRRARPGWQPREISAALSEALWRRVKSARFFLRKAPVGIELARDGDSGAGDGGRYRVTVKNATPTVTVIGTPAELTMWAMGRTSAANVRFDGTGEAVAALRAWRS